MSKDPYFLKQISPQGCVQGFNLFLGIFPSATPNLQSGENIGWLNNPSIARLSNFKSGEAVKILSLTLRVGDDEITQQMLVHCKRYIAL